MSTAADDATPALLDSTTRVKPQLEKAASQLLFGRKIRLSSSAFTTSHTLLVEQKQHKDKHGLPIDGRQMETKAILLSLWTDGQQCWLKRQDTGKQVLLESLRCKAVE